MILRSNIKSVIARLQRYQVGVDPAVLRAIQPELWAPVLERTAQLTLRALANTEAERQAIPFFIQTLSVVAFGGGFRATMGGPGGNDRVVEEAIGIMQDIAFRTYNGIARRRQGGPLPLEGTQEQAVNLVREGIRDWVRTEKRKKTGPGERDRGLDGRPLSDEVIAERIEWILFDPKIEFNKEAIARMAGHIQTFMQEREQQAIGLPPGKVAEWLQAVLLAWRHTIELQLPLRIRQELKRLRDSLATQLFEL